MTLNIKTHSFTTLRRMTLSVTKLSKMTLKIMTHRKMILSRMTLIIRKLYRMTLSIMTLSIMAHTIMKCNVTIKPLNCSYKPAI
jgi:hypothetical protein